MILGFELRASCFLGRYSTAWAIPPVVCAQVIFELGSHFLSKLAWNVIFLFMFSVVAGMTCAHHHTQLFPLRLGLMNFFPGPNWNHDFPSLSLLHSCDDRCMTLCPGICWDVVFLPRLTSTSQVCLSL
jgi:hypothetical protein